MKLERADEIKIITTSLKELYSAIFLKYGIQSVISKDYFFQINPNNSIPETDIDKANQELSNLYAETSSGSFFTSEQISKIEKQITKADPSNLVETALQDARNLL